MLFPFIYFVFILKTNLLLRRAMEDLFFQNENSFTSPDYIYAYVKFQIIHKAVKRMKQELPVLDLPKDNLVERWVLWY